MPLTDEGRRQAECLEDALGEWITPRVLTSPLARARETCRLAGLGDRAELSDALLEWDYGEFEGLTTSQIREAHPGWDLWRDGCPGGESAAEVGARVDPLVDELRASETDVALFAHGHVLRVLAVRWVELPPSRGSALARHGHRLGARIRTRDPHRQALERARPVVASEHARYRLPVRHDSARGQ